MSNTVQQIKDKLGILDVVAPYVKLTKAGKYHRGLSPFGKEKTPSFYVNPERGTYYCFSSNQGGDHFEFIQKMEGVDFKGALTILAEKAGVRIEYRADDGSRNIKKDALEKVYAMTREAQQFFTETLTDDCPAYQYALSRGLTKETIESWQLGYAPDGWRGLLEYFGSKGYTPAELASAGLIKEADEKSGTFYDRFRNRLMFPITDSAGRTIAFTGRALDSKDSAKYLNSPETEVFKKSEVLFGMHRAKDSIRTRGFAILVEGQFDLILLHQAGFTNTIALSGTALSHKHLQYILRYADNLMLCLDADKAGLAASAKNAHAALQHGMRVKAVMLPKGKDPADIVCEDPKIFTNLIKDGQSIVEFFLSVLSREQPDTLRLLQQVERIVLPLIVAMKSPIERNHFVDIVARAIASTPEAVREALPKHDEIVAPKNVDAAEVRRGSFVTPTQEQPQESSLESRRVRILATIANYPETPLANRLISEYARIIDAPFEESTDSLVSRIGERALFEAGRALGESPEENAAEDLIRMFEEALLHEEYKKALTALRIAESSRDATSIESSITVLKEITERLARLS